jgi:hypothetical protein
MTSTIAVITWWLVDMECRTTVGTASSLKLAKQHHLHGWPLGSSKRNSFAFGVPFTPYTWPAHEAKGRGYATHSHPWTMVLVWLRRYPIAYTNIRQQQLAPVALLAAASCL